MVDAHLASVTKLLDIQSISYIIYQRTLRCRSQHYIRIVSNDFFFFFSQTILSFEINLDFCCLQDFFFFSLWSNLWHVEVPGPGIEPVMPQHQPLNWTGVTLNLLDHQGTPTFNFFFFFFFCVFLPFLGPLLQIQAAAVTQTIAHGNAGFVTH